MWKRPHSASSSFNLTEWRVRVYLITAAQARRNLTEVPHPWCLIQAQVELWLKCSSHFSSLSVFPSMQFLLLLDFYFVFLFFLHRSYWFPPLLYVFSGPFICGNWMTPPLPEPGQRCLSWAMVCYSMNITTAISLFSCSSSPCLSLSHTLFAEAVTEIDLQFNDSSYKGVSFFEDFQKCIVGFTFSQR